VSYDETYSKYGPGQLLRGHLIEGFFNQTDVELVDFQGPITDATGMWATRSYEIARLVIAPHRIAGRALFTGYRLAAPIVRRFRRKNNS